MVRSRGHRATWSGTADRREFLATAGVIGAGALAGCTGGSETSPTAASMRGSGADGLVDRTLVSVASAPIADLQFNSYNQNNLANTEYLFDDLIYYQSRDDNYLPGVVTDWDVTDEAVTLSIREGVPWHHGGEVTAADVVRKLKLEFYTGLDLSNYIPVEEIAAIDAHTVKLPFETPVSEQIFLNEAVDIPLDTPKAEFQAFVDDFANGGDGTNADGTALASYTVTDPNGTGPFQFEKRTERDLIMSRVARHPDASGINFPECRARFLQGNQAVWQALNNETIDAVPVLSAPPNIVDGFPDSVREFRMVPNYGAAISWNFEHKHYKKRAVRQAIAHVVDRKAVAANSGPRSKKPVDIPTGIAGNIPDSEGNLPANAWLGDQIDRYEPYHGQNTKRAAELLRGAGFQKDDGAWYDSDGDKLTFEVKVPGAWDDYVKAVQTYNQELNDFGIDAELIPRDADAYFGEDLYGSAGFQISMLQWTSGRRYPYFNFVFLFDSSEQTDIRHYPAKPKLPPFDDPEGEPVVHEPAKHLRELATVEPGSRRETDLIRRFAWIVNQDLPALPLQETIDQSYVVTEGWNTVSSGDPSTHVPRPPTYLPRVGKLKAADGTNASRVTSTGTGAAANTTGDN